MEINDLSTVYKVKRLTVTDMDLILGYPNKNTVYIGFFMMHSALQGIGLGSKLIEECIVCLSKVGFCNIELAVDKGNPQSRHFWMKRNFKDRDPEYKNKSSDYIPMIRRI